jgi:hypothetical protein
VQNVIFDGALAASCRIQLTGNVPPSLVETLRNGNSDIIGVDLLQIV